MASDSLSEQEIQFRKRARRRLVGAIALVLLMVTLLPMVLDDQEPSAPQQEIAISIPSQDGTDFSSKVVPAPAPAVTEPVAPGKPALDMASPIEPTPVVPPPPAQPDVPPQAPVAKQPVAEPAKPAVAKDVTPAPVPTQAQPEKAKAEDAATPSKTGFSVQIGVFSDTAKVKQLQAKLKAQGIASYTEKLGSKIRLRSGPYPTRSAAEKVQTKLKQMNMTSMVVTNK